MNYLDKKDMNPEGLKKFFEEAIINKEAVEIHTTNEEFPHEIDLIPYDQVETKMKWYLDNILSYDSYDKVDFTKFEDGAVKCLGILDKVRGIVSKTITAVKINWGESAIKESEKAISAAAETIIDEPIKVVDDKFFVRVLNKENIKAKICIKCGKEMKIDTSTMMMSHPPQYRASCECGAISYVPTHLVDGIEEWVPLRQIKERL